MALREAPRPATNCRKPLRIRRQWRPRRRSRLRDVYLLTRFFFCLIGVLGVGGFISYSYLVFYLQSGGRP